MPFAKLSHLSPDFSTVQRPRLGIRYVQGLYSKTGVKSFASVQQENNLPASDIFTYLHITHCLAQLPNPLYTLSSKAWSYFTLSRSAQKGTSLFYNIFQQKQVFTKSKPLFQWESDLEASYSDQQWLRAFKSVYQSTCCSSLWEMPQKIFLKWYSSPIHIRTSDP